MKREILILAKSAKRDNYCIAGVDINSNEFIRPISKRQDIENAVPKDVVANINVYDIVEIDIESHVPTTAQKENYYYNENIPWNKIGTSSNIQKYIQNPNKIFFDTYKSVDSSVLTGESLILVNVTSPKIVVELSPYNGHKKIRLDFQYNNDNYKYISVSDPIIYNQYISRPIGEYPLTGPLCVLFSLTDKYIDDKYYKMAASFL
ncbi:MAG TPA: hypothetical protein VIG40_01825 [Tissierellaceae bacterium]